MGGGCVLTVFGFCALPLAWFYDVAAHVVLTPFEPGAGRAGKAQQPAARRCRFDSGSNSLLSRKKCLRVGPFCP